jgi:hypothetical protein
MSTIYTVPACECLRDALTGCARGTFEFCEEHNLYGCVARHGYIVASESPLPSSAVYLDEP